jgi:hypothetical protein
MTFSLHPQGCLFMLHFIFTDDESVSIVFHVSSPSERQESGDEAGSRT